jgi:hypothetical protein
MTAAMQGPQDIINAALRHAGLKYSVGNLFDGSDAARAALDVYGQSRDALLKLQSWQFAQRQAQLSVAPVSAIIPWQYEYVLPADFLEVRALIPSGTTSPELNPADILFTVFNDSRATPSRVLLTNQSPAILLYTAQVTDMTQWDVGFAEALINELASVLLPVLGDARLAQLTEARAVSGRAQALGSTAMQPPDDAPAVARGATRQ